MGKTFVLSVGGSLVAKADGINVSWLKKFAQLINQEISQGSRFYIVVGGGSTARQYIQAGRNAARLSDSDLDWIGIGATRLNAELLRSIFGAVAHQEVIIDPTKAIKTKKKIVIAAGSKPGWSTDYVAVSLAKVNKVSQVINLSNIDYAYDRDPRRYPGAKPLYQISWPDFYKVVGKTWKPGANTPFDPVASRAAAASRISVVIANGEKLANLRRCFKYEKFVGTVIS